MEILYNVPVTVLAPVIVNPSGQGRLQGGGGTWPGLAG